MAPVFLVHGAGSNSSAWVKGVDANGDPSTDHGITALLAQRHITFSNKINLTPNGERDKNALELKQYFRDGAAEFGAKGIHVIAHSKGGLDTRAFLAYHAKELKEESGIHVLSLSTLTTPHHGSVLADLAVLQRGKGRVEASDADFKRYLSADRKLGWLNAIPGVDIGPQEPGLYDLETGNAWKFNQDAPFPYDVELFTYGASADTNADDVITAGDEPPTYAGAPNEAAPLIPKILTRLNRGKVRLLATSFFRLGQRTSAAAYTPTRRYVQPFSFRRAWGLKLRPGAFLTDIRGDGDLFVTIKSSMLPREALHFDFTGAEARNHTSARTSQVGEKLLQTIRERFPVQ
jgi:hypothetical protein